MIATLHMLPTKRFPITPEETGKIGRDIVDLFIAKTLPKESALRCLQEITAAAFVFIQNDVDGADTFCIDLCNLIYGFTHHLPQDT
jgi:hypothetical protein